MHMSVSKISRSRAGLFAAALSALPVVASGQAATTPTLVVLIAVDQMRADYLERFAPQLTGGLARLYRGGAVFTNAMHDHAITETAPGHSVMLAGRFPRGTGIVSNSLGVPDSSAPLVGGGGEGASPARFRGTTLVDWLHAKDPRSRALSVSRKDRGAILPVGRSKQNVFWYAPDGRFTTSTYYADTLPAWVNRFNARRIPFSYAGATWSLILPERSYPEPDSVLYENFGSADVRFPHRYPADSTRAAQLFSEYPAMDSATAQLALEGVAAMKLGAGPQTDVLSVSFSTTDAVGHRYGPDSREVHDQILRLDRYLGGFIDSLYKLRDSSHIIFALTADHGVAPFPELRAEREHVIWQRVDINEAFGPIVAGLRAAGFTQLPIAYEEGMIFVDRRAIEARKLKPDSVIGAIAASLKRIDGVLRVDTVKTLTKKDTTRDDVARRWYHMIPPDVTPELVMTIAPYAGYESIIQASHGSPHDYDAHVPLIFYGPSFKTGKYDDRVRVVDIAPTFAAVLGTKPLETIDGRVLSQALKK
jgi:predicted AlkP superfamily pyrophosphatase or phosphodiesterase